MNLVIFGPPGAGKGTQSKFIVEKFNMFQLSTGEFLRKEISDNTKLGKKISSVINSGELVSDQIVSDLIEEIIADHQYKNRIIFDGYPRNLNQAKTLQDLLSKHGKKIDLVLKLSVSLETIKKRISQRQSLEKREDDNEETAIKRFQTYENNMTPIIEFYKKLNLLKEVNGESKISEINDEIRGLIDAIEGWLWIFSQYKYAFRTLDHFIWLG